MTKTEFCEAVGNRIALHRCEQGFTRWDVADLLGISEERYTLIERGLARSNRKGRAYDPRVKLDLLVLLNICKIINTDLATILADLPAPDWSTGDVY